MDAFRAFASRLIDYAGLFPPAALPLPEAAGAYLAHAVSDDAWMLGRFVCPSARLAELVERLPSRASGPVPLSVILADPFREMEEVRAALAGAETRAEVEAYEARMPAALTGDVPADRIAAHVRGAGRARRAAGLPDRPVFWEADLSRISAVAEGIAGAGEERNGLKIRCGGSDRASVPPPEPVARAVAACREEGIPLKATAGLHHPVRRADEALGASTHGFLNLFGAAVLAAVHGLGEADVLAVLTETSASSFRFQGDAFSWRGLSATAEEIAVARFTFATSFGSCSFDEPREDLRDLGLLPRRKETHG